MNNEKIIADGTFTLAASDWSISSTWPTPEFRWLETETGRTLQQKWIEECNDRKTERWADVPVVRER